MFSLESRNVLISYPTDNHGLSFIQYSKHRAIQPRSPNKLWVSALVLGSVLAPEYECAKFSSCISSSMFIYAHWNASFIDIYPAQLCTRSPPHSVSLHRLVVNEVKCHERSHLNCSLVSSPIIILCTFTVVGLQSSGKFFFGTHIITDKALY